MNSQESWDRIVAAASAPTSVADPRDVLRAAVTLGLDLGPTVLGCSLTELTEAGGRTPAFANRLSMTLDQAQYDAGAGPCLSAAFTGAVQQVGSIAEVPEYREFAATAGRHGVHSSLSIPLPRVRRPTALNFYASGPGGLATDRALATADLLARCVGALLPGPGPEEPIPAAELAGARRRRERLEQARQLLMTSAGLGPQEAFDALVRRSRQERRSLFQVVEDLLTGSAAGPAGTP
jgi:hypothetical protein